MIILTTLKQKDLAAVSAQQLLIQPNYQSEYQPVQIEKFQLFTINGDFNSNDVINAIRSSYIFSNPNKHHLIVTPNEFLSDHYLYFNVSRKHQLNLNSKVIQLKKIIPSNQSIESIFMSDLWAFKYKSNDFTTNDFIENVKNHFIVSSTSNIAPFAHPVLHNVNTITYSQLSKQFYEA